MRIIEDFEAVPAEARGAVLAVGNFDGVHRGHAHLVGRLRAKADELGTRAIALTFDPHPVAILRPEKAPTPLTWTERTVELLEGAGASEVGVFKTGPWLLDLSAREFFDRVIVGQFGAMGMVEGPNFGFGRDRGGDASLLARWCAEEGLAFEVVEPTTVGGTIVSSSRIRAALDRGDVAEAAELLGRPHRLRGRVVRGAGRGAKLGFPTANLDGIDTQIPEDGVYAARAFVAGRGLPAAAHIGPNATFGESARSVEVHLIDFDGNLYGHTLELDMLERLRTSRKFPDLTALLAQIGEDVDRAKRVVGNGGSSF